MSQLTGRCPRCTRLMFARHSRSEDVMLRIPSRLANAPDRLRPARIALPLPASGPGARTSQGHTALPTPVSIFFGGTYMCLRLMGCSAGRRKQIRWQHGPRDGGVKEVIRHLHGISPPGNVFTVGCIGLYIHLLLRSGQSPIPDLRFSSQRDKRGNRTDSLPQQSESRLGC